MSGSPRCISLVLRGRDISAPLSWLCRRPDGVRKPPLSVPETALSSSEAAAEIPSKQTEITWFRCHKNASFKIIVVDIQEEWLAAGALPILLGDDTDYRVWKDILLPLSRTSENCGGWVNRRKVFQDLLKRVKKITTNGKRFFLSAPHLTFA